MTKMVTLPLKSLLLCTCALAATQQLSAGKATTARTTSAIASTSTTPPVDEIQIESVSTSGSGCPQKEVSITISDDRTAVTLGFDEFNTYIGPGVNASQNDKKCLIHLSVRYPSGYTFAVLDATYHGYAQLDPGVTGNISSVYQFEDGNNFSALSGSNGVTGASAASSSTSVELGSSTAARRSNTVASTVRDTTGEVYTETDTIPANEVINAPCGRLVDLSISTRIDMKSTNSAASGELTDDDATFAFTQGVHFGWSQCS